MTLDLELTKDQGSFLFVCTLRKGRFFLHHFLEKLLKSIFNSLMLSFSNYKGSEMHL